MMSLQRKDSTASVLSLERKKNPCALVSIESLKRKNAPVSVVSPEGKMLLHFWCRCCGIYVSGIKKGCC